MLTVTGKKLKNGAGTIEPNYEIIDALLRKNKNGFERLKIMKNCTIQSDMLKTISNKKRF